MALLPRTSDKYSSRHRQERGRGLQLHLAVRKGLPAGIITSNFCCTLAQLQSSELCPIWDTLCKCMLLKDMGHCSHTVVAKADYSSLARDV